MHYNVYSYMCDICRVADVCTLNNDLTWLRTPTYIMNLITAVIGVAIFMLGAVCIKEIRLRGLDSVCGFHAQLKANLLILRASAGITGEPKKESHTTKPSEYDFAKEASQSVFMWFADDGTISQIKLTNILPMTCYDNADIDEFIEQAKSTLNLFKQSSGQIPLSSKMYEYLNELFVTLLSVVNSYEKKKRPMVLYPFKEGIEIEYLDSASQVCQKAGDFNKLTYNIITETDGLTKSMLSNFWTRFERRKKYQRIKEKVFSGEKNMLNTEYPYLTDT